MEQVEKFELLSTVDPSFARSQSKEGKTGKADGKLVIIY